jgi:hypothetical protein
MTNVVCIPATSVVVKLRAIALVVVDLDPAPRIAVIVCIAVCTIDGAIFNFASGTTKYLETL